MEGQRVTGIIKIKNEEEYEFMKTELVNYVKEYYDFVGADKVDARNDMKQIALNAATRLSENIDVLSSEEKINELYNIQATQARFNALGNDTYIPNLMRNITANLLSVEEYEARKENRNVFEIAIRNNYWE